MKKTREFFLVGVFLLLRTFVVPAQGLQLLRNVGFDTLIRCPTDLTQYMDTLPYPFEHWWVEMTPDAFDSCATGGVVSTPTNFFGNANGRSYAGAIGYRDMDSSWGFWEGDMLVSLLLQPVYTGALRISFDYHKAQYGGPDCGFKIILGTDTILTPLLPNQAWTHIDTLVQISQVVDTIKIGPGGNVGPMVDTKSAYYYFDNIELWLVDPGVFLDRPKLQCDHEWNSPLMVGGYEMKSCRICNERSATMRK